MSRASIRLCCATSSIPPFPASDLPDSTLNLPAKLRAIAAAGFEAIELAFPDLLAFACQQQQKDVGENEFNALVVAAELLKELCGELKLKILMLQPFANYEGWAENSAESRDAEERADGWIKIMEAANIGMLQVGSTDATNITTDRNRIADDLRRLSDKLAQHKFTLAYENWAWSSHAPDWASIHEISQLVDRKNFGLCLDTFQTAGYEWGDPTTASGTRNLDGSHSTQELDEAYRDSLKRLSKTTPHQKIFLLQVSDAYQLTEPLSADRHSDGLLPRARWSKAFRPMPSTTGGYLPIVDVGAAVLQTGFRGWFSLEIFDSKATFKEGEDLAVFAEKAFNSTTRFVEACEQKPKD